jgi:hypothetical protein
MKEESIECGHLTYGLEKFLEFGCSSSLLTVLEAANFNG